MSGRAGPTSEWLGVPAAGAVRVLTVDDQALFRGVARAVIDATPGFEAVGEAAGGEEALAAVEPLDPALVICDVRMPGLDGIEVARRLAAARPDTLVVLVSVEEPAHASVGGGAGRARAALGRKQDFAPRLLERLWRARRPI